MTAKEFWEDDPQLLVSYHTFFVKKKEQEAREHDYVSWLSGLYIHESLSANNSILIHSISRMMGSKNKDRPKLEYPKKPYSEIEDEVARVKEKEKSKYQQFNEDFIFFGSMKSRFNEEIDKKERR